MYHVTSTSKANFEWGFWWVRLGVGAKPTKKCGIQSIIATWIIASVIYNSWVEGQISWSCLRLSLNLSKTLNIEKGKEFNICLNIVPPTFHLHEILVMYLRQMYMYLVESKIFNLGSWGLALTSLWLSDMTVLFVADVGM